MSLGHTPQLDAIGHWYCRHLGIDQYVCLIPDTQTLPPEGHLLLSRRAEYSLSACRHTKP